MRSHARISHSMLPAVRHALRQATRGIGSGHAAEALASGFGFRSNAAFRAALPDMSDPLPSDLDVTAVVRRLASLGHDGDARGMEHSVESLVVRALSPDLSATPSATTHASNRVEIGGRYHHPDGYQVHVVAGAYLSNGRVSNFWYWRKVGDDGVLEDELLSGYGNVFYGVVPPSDGRSGPSGRADTEGTVEFTWTGQDGQTAEISYRTADAEAPLFAKPDGTEMPIEDEWNWLCHREASINHRYDEAERAGIAYELTQADRKVLARLHLLEERHPGIGMETSAPTP